MRTSHPCALPDSVGLLPRRKKETISANSPIASTQLKRRRSASGIFCCCGCCSSRSALAWVTRCCDVTIRARRKASATRLSITRWSAAPILPGSKNCFAVGCWFPYVARPFYWFAQRYLPSWNAGFFGLLVSSALFCATTACLIVSIGNRLFHDLATALLGATLYLLSFAISNLQLSGLIDAGEACFMAAVVWSLLNDKWGLLPLWGLAGGAGKRKRSYRSSCIFAV